MKWIARNIWLNSNSIETMKLVEINWSPTHRQLRQFGVVCLIALPLIAWIWGAGFQLIGTFAGIGLAIAAVGMVLPAALKYLFIGLSVIAIPIGLVPALPRLQSTCRVSRICRAKHR